MWKELGFEVIGCMPEEANATNGDGTVDALMMDRELDK
jgi:hypothetical protein